YDTMANMAQDFSFRYPLVDGQGNFGSIDGDEPAAMRYTEARLSTLSETFLEELDEDAVDFQPNFDDSLEEPIVLPAQLPGVLLNGAWGISVGMTTKIPPHNISEVIDGVIQLIDNPDLNLDSLMEYIKGPDFPTGAILLGREGIKEAYRTGKGKVRMRAKTKLEGDQIIVTEIPFQVKKSTIVERIADKVKSGTIDGISEVRDESDREGLRVVIGLKRGAEPEVVVNQLFKYTPLERTYGANFLVIVDGNPRRLSLKEILNSFIDFRRQVVRRRTEHRLEKAEARAHILEGLTVALEDAQRIIEIIRKSPDRSSAREMLMERYQFTEKQANAILKMQLGRLTSLEREKITSELEEKREAIEKYTTILSSSLKLDKMIKKELKQLKKEFGDQRRSLITEQPREVDADQLIPDHSLVVQITENGLVNAPRCESYKLQNRAGKGVICMRVEETDRLQLTLGTNSRNDLFFFTDQDQVYKLKGHQLPSQRRDSKGTSLRNHLELSEDESVTDIFDIGDLPLAESYCLLTTQRGYVSKNPLENFSSVHTSGIQALNTESGDSLSAAVTTYGEGDILLATRNGKVIRFDQEELRSAQRPSKGVIGMEVAPNDQIIGIQTYEYDVPSYEKLVLFVTELGLGKLVPLDEFSVQGRGGKGNLGIKIGDEDGLKKIQVVDRGPEEVFIVSEEGKGIRLDLDEISQFQRYARGVKLMDLESKDRIADVTIINPH
ncbi:MAG: DNA gyrase/topoisomerase IV subunit A, partial [Candidatus Bipolaricaulota bacterium]